MTARSPVRLPFGVWATLAGVLALLASVANRYGFHRDELYFLVPGRRLDWGFVDQPPLVPFLARMSEIVFGPSPAALRVLPALAIATTGILAASMARRFGGGTPAQVIATIGAAGSGIALAIGHLLSTVAFDYLLWTLAVWLLVRLLDDGDPRWWLAVGATVGVGLQNKSLMAAFAAAVLVGIAVSTRRRLLAGWWPWLGAGIAASIALPNLAWQAANDWPQFEMAAALADRSDGPVAFVLEQVGLLSIVLAVPAAVGLWRLLRSPGLVRWRPLGITFVVLYAVFLVTGGKAYYMAPMYPLVLAVGAVWIEELATRARQVMTAVVAVGVLVGVFIALPVVPESAVSTVDATGELGETAGWPELVDQVQAVIESIPAGQRDSVAIFTGSYGEAGAIDVLGPARGLPPASSGHNTYWLWGPPEEHGPVIGVGWVAYVLESMCPTVVQVGTITNPWGIDNEANGRPLLLCMEPSRQLADVWDGARHYD